LYCCVGGLWSNMKGQKISYLWKSAPSDMR
jgi:hypothetical protein